jgi:phosphoribosylformimino-5-aminoimidazole carboxamide ribotide isomerase
MKIIPAIDLRQGRCVRLLKGDFDKETEYSSNPLEIGRQFARLDVSDMHIVDLDGALTGTQQNRDIVAELVRDSGFDVQVGGGIRSRDDVADWLGKGVTRCVVGSLAVREPDLVMAWLDEFGPDAIVIALDVRLEARGRPMLTTQGWTEESDMSLWECLDEFGKSGIRHLLCTDVLRDGAFTGPNFDLYVEILNRYPSIQLQSSGGVRNIDDLALLRELGVPAAITGKALLDGKITAEEIRTFRRSE